MENSQSNMFILKVSASDRDTGAHGFVSYTLHGPDADKFHLNQWTGNSAARFNPTSELSRLLELAIASPTPANTFSPC